MRRLFYTGLAVIVITLFFSSSSLAQGWPGPCTEQCEQVQWNGPKTIVVNTGSCIFTYTVYWRTACGSKEFQIVELQHVLNAPCSFTVMYQAALGDWIRNHRNDGDVLFGPDGEGCILNWRVSGGACWYHTVETSNGIQFMTYKPCNVGLCCWVGFKVCEDADGDIGIEVHTKKVPMPTDVDCTPSNCSDYTCETFEDIGDLDDGEEYDPGV